MAKVLLSVGRDCWAKPTAAIQEAAIKSTTQKRILAISRLITARVIITLICAMTALIAVPQNVIPAITIHAQAAVTAEAVGSANVRGGTGTDYPVVAEIKAGTRYPVIARSARYPWVLIQLSNDGANATGWVFLDLVQIDGDLNSVPFSEQVVQADPGFAPSSTPSPTTPANNFDPGLPTSSPVPGVLDSVITGTLAGTSSVQTSSVQITFTPLAPAFTATPAALAYAEAKGEANLRYGPGPEFPRIGSISAGTRYPITRRHSQVPWIEIAVDSVAGGRAWIFLDLIDITGDIFSVPVTGASNFGYPTLTPTSPVVGTAVAPFAPALLALPTSADPDIDAQARAVMRSVTEQIYDYLLAKGFEPRTRKQASAFIMDLRTGESYNLNPGVAFSGMSLIKFPILVSLYRKLNGPPDAELAMQIADMIICSENTASNFILRVLGDGDEYRGAEYVTQTMQLYGLKDTFLVGPLFVATGAGNPTPTTRAVTTIQTGVDQLQTAPDPFNQSTPSDMGYLMAGVYQCAVGNDGPLRAAFADASDQTVDQDECRQILRTLGANDIPAMLRAGLPPGTYLAHKHGWVNEVNGDAGLVVSPGGDYIVVIMLYTRDWLLYDESFPNIAEVSRLVYNAVNPLTPLATTNTQPVPLCSIDTIQASDPNLISDLQQLIGRPIK